MGWQSWQSYDSVAGTYDRVCAPGNEQLGRDLVDLVGVEHDAVVLDVGTGTGVVAAAAGRRLDHGLVVGIDPSSGMLAVARVNAPLIRVRAGAPCLPFRDSAFDIVVASLVISLVDRYEVALADMTRVLRPGGRLGLTTSGSLDDDVVDDSQQRELTRIWTTVSGRFTSVDAIEDALADDCKRQGWFGDPAHLRAALLARGLTDVGVHGRAYRREVARDDALAAYEPSAWGRFLRSMLGDDGWSQFRHEAAAAAAGTLPDRVTLVDEVLIAVGRKGYDTRP